MLFVFLNVIFIHFQFVNSVAFFASRAPNINGLLNPRTMFDLSVISR